VTVTVPLLALAMAPPPPPVFSWPPPLLPVLPAELFDRVLLVTVRVPSPLSAATVEPAAVLIAAASAVAKPPPTANRRADVPLTCMCCSSLHPLRPGYARVRALPRFAALKPGG